MRALNITGYRCVKCGKVHFPYHDRCISCKGREFEQIKPQGNPRLLAYTQIFNLPWGFEERFIVLGVVEFENCIRAMGRIKVNSLDELKPGMALKPSWAPVRVTYGEKHYGLVLEPLDK